MATVVEEPGERSAGKRVFAKRVRAFAKRAPALPGFAALGLGCAAAAVLATVAGAFGTGGMPLGVRAGFWATLMGWSWFKWQLWFAGTVRRPTDWPRAGALGGVLLNLLLPFEIGMGLRLWGFAPPPLPGTVWMQGMAIGATIFALMMVVGRRWTTPAAEPSTAPPAIRPSGVLARAGVAAVHEVAAVVAEDHYCRLNLDGGRSRLVHARFSDAVAELAGVAGAQVHRGAWVADRAVKGAARTDRRWRLLLADGTEVPVSATHLPAVRARGWLQRR